MSNKEIIMQQDFQKETYKNVRNLANISIRLASDVLSAAQFNILCKLVDGKSVWEVAHECKNSEASIRSSVSKAMNAIRSRLIEYENVKQKFIEKNAKIDSLKREVFNLNHSLNELKKLSLTERTKKLCDCILHDVKKENIELQVKIDLLNKTINDLKKQNDSIKRKNLYYEWFTKNYNITTENLYEKLQIGELLNLNLEEFSLPTRVMNVFKKLNITKLVELVRLKKSDLMEVKGCGKAIIEELEYILESLNLSFNYGDANENFMIYLKYKNAKEEFDKKYPLDKIIAN